MRNRKESAERDITITLSILVQVVYTSLNLMSSATRQLMAEGNGYKYVLTTLCQDVFSLRGKDSDDLEQRYDCPFLSVKLAFNKM